MASPYFDATATADLSLILSSVRDHDDLETVAARAERDVIDLYTRQEAPKNYVTPDTFVGGTGYYLGDGTWVALRNYVPDASQCTDAAFVTAMKDTIADVINWRLRQLGENALVTSVSGQNIPGKSMHPLSTQPFPNGEWTFRLRRWDLRQPNYVI